MPLALPVFRCIGSHLFALAEPVAHTNFGYVQQANGNLAATGATEHDVRLMREHCGPAVQVKASGGIRSYEDAQWFVALGATRLGTSSTEAIARGEHGRQTQHAAG